MPNEPLPESPHLENRSEASPRDASNPESPSLSPLESQSPPQNFLTQNNSNQSSDAPQESSSSDPSLSSTSSLEESIGSESLNLTLNRVIEIKVVTESFEATYVSASNLEIEKISSETQTLSQNNIFSESTKTEELKCEVERLKSTKMTHEAQIIRLRKYSDQNAKKGIRAEQTVANQQKRIRKLENQKAFFMKKFNQCLEKNPWNFGTKSQICLKKIMQDDNPINFDSQCPDMIFSASTIETWKGSSMQDLDFLKETNEQQQKHCYLCDSMVQVKYQLIQKVQQQNINMNKLNELQKTYRIENFIQKLFKEGLKKGKKQTKSACSKQFDHFPKQKITNLTQTVYDINKFSDLNSKNEVKFAIQSSNKLQAHSEKMVCTMNLSEGQQFRSKINNKEEKTNHSVSCHVVMSAFFSSKRKQQARLCSEGHQLVQNPKNSTSETQPQPLQIDNSKVFITTKFYGGRWHKVLMQQKKGRKKAKERSFYFQRNSEGQYVIRSQIEIDKIHLVFLLLFLIIPRSKNDAKDCPSIHINIGHGSKNSIPKGQNLYQTKDKEQSNTEIYEEIVSVIKLMLERDFQVRCKEDGSWMKLKLNQENSKSKISVHHGDVYRNNIYPSEADFIIDLHCLGAYSKVDKKDSGFNEHLYFLDESWRFEMLFIQDHFYRRLSIFNLHKIERINVMKADWVYTMSQNCMVRRNLDINLFAGINFMQFHCPFCQQRKIFC